MTKAWTAAFDYENIYKIIVIWGAFKPQYIKHIVLKYTHARVYRLSVLTLRELKRMKLVPENLLGLLEYLCKIKKVKES